MKIKHIDHICIVVNDLDSAKTFFVDLGFSVLGETSLKGEWVGSVIGLKDVHDELVMLQAPDGQINIELVKFHNPIDSEGIRLSYANTLGLRHIAFEVEDLEKMVNMLKEKGSNLIGEIEIYEDVYMDCFIRGPEGIILELAERLKK